MGLCGYSWQWRGRRLTASIASFTRELLINPLLKRLVMRSLFVAPELRQAMLVGEVKPRARLRMRVENVRMGLEIILLYVVL